MFSVMKNPAAQASTGAPFLGRPTPVLWKTLLTAALASLSILGMLLAFHAVMRGAVQRAESRQQALAAHAEATWQCKALRGPRARGSCLSLLNAAAPAVVVAQALNLETGLPVD